MDDATFLLHLSRSSQAFVCYESEGGDVLLACSRAAVRSVLQDRQRLHCPTHPFQDLFDTLQPSGRAWLGLQSDAAESEALRARIQGFFRNERAFGLPQNHQRLAALSAREFCLGMQTVFFALACELLFGLRLASQSRRLAIAAGVVEEARARARGGGSLQRVQPSSPLGRALETFAVLARRIPRDGRDAGRHVHVVRETLLSATMPLVYSFIWSLLLLGRREDVQDLLRLEATQESRGDDEGSRSGPTAAVVKESLRLYPPVWAMSRVVLDAVKLGEARLEPGERVVVSPYARHRSDHLWRQPECFIPERFSECAPPPYAYIPFGAGASTCPAARWNLPVLVLAIQAFVRQYSLSVSKLPPARPLVALRPSLRFKPVVHRLLTPPNF